MRFSEFEKKVIKEISEFNITNPQLLGKLISNLIFKRGEGALFVSTEPDTCHLIAYNDGGRIHHLMRRRVVDIISILEFLENERYIVVAEEPKETRYFFYQKCNQILKFDITEPNQNSSHTLHNVRKVKEFADLGEGEKLFLTIEYKDGHPRSLSCHIQLNDGNTLSSIEFGHNLRHRLKRFMTSYAYPTTRLKDLVKNNFVTAQDKYNQDMLEKACQQLCKAETAILIALVSLAFSIIFGCMNNFNLN